MTESKIEFNRRAMECSSHRMNMIASEAIFADKYEHGNPIQYVFTFKCSGSCQQVIKQTIIHKDLSDLLPAIHKHAGKLFDRGITNFNEDNIE